MAQSFGYLLASVGPIIVGLLFDLTGSWDNSLMAIILVTIVMIGFGIGASRNKYVL